VKSGSDLLKLDLLLERTARMNPIKDIADHSRKMDGAKFVHLQLLRMKHRGDRARMVASAKHLGSDVQSILECPEDLNGFVHKSAVGPGTTTHSTWAAQLAQLGNLGSAFLSTLVNHGTFDRTVGSMQPGKMHSKLMVQTAVMTGTVGAEGQWKALTSGTFDTDTLAVRKSYAMAVVSNELVRFASTPAVALVNRSLQEAVTAATGLDFLTQVVADNTPVGSTGGGLTGLLTDVQVAMDAVATGSESKLFWVMNPDTAKAVTMMPTGSGARAFPEMSPLGGQFFGLPAIVSDQIGTYVVLMDAHSFVGDAGVVMSPPSTPPYGSWMRKAPPSSR
jgi:hypothetical protein